jgi:hypothetical protein
MRARWRLVVGAALVAFGVIALYPRAVDAFRHWDASNTTHAASDAEQVGILRAALDPRSGLAEEVMRGARYARWLLVDESIALEECESTESITACVHVRDEMKQVSAFPPHLRAGLLQANRIVAAMPDPGLLNVQLGGRSRIDLAFPGDRDVDVSWNAFRESNPGIIGFLTASRAVLTEDSNEALVYIEFSCGGECGSGHLVRIARIDGVWTMRESVRLWIS